MNDFSIFLLAVRGVRMQKMYLVWILIQFIIEGATNPPTWTEPASTSISIASTDCGDVTHLNADSGDGSSVLFSLESQSPTGGGFTITDNFFGNKILTCVQGSITAAFYAVVVRATHDGGNGLHADLTLTITFTDVAPAAVPVFVKPSPNTADDDHPIALLETIQAGETVLTLSATDADSDDATLIFNMDASAEATRELFEIAGKELKVKDGVVNDYFDAEKGGVVLQYPIVLEVSDRGSSTTLSTTINVQDVNDNSPAFSGTFTAEIKANVPDGYTVFTITATDSDRTATNNQVTLSLSEISEFNLDGDKIKVSAGVNFDAKTQSTYTLIVTASDNAPVDPKTINQDFTVTIKAVTVTIGTTECTASEVGSSGKTCNDYVPNSECDTSASPSVCKCQAGYEANNDNTACDAAFLVTFTIGSTECTASEVGSSGQTCSDYVANSECDTSASPSVCKCQVGYEANNDNTACDADIDECASNPCQNCGTCYDGIDRYICDCLVGYDGDNCENNILPTECDNSALIGVAVSGWVSFAVILVVFIIFQVRKGQGFKESGHTQAIKGEEQLESGDRDKYITLQHRVNNVNASAEYGTLEPDTVNTTSN